MLEQVLSRYPRDRALYFVAEAYTPNEQLKRYTKLLGGNGLHVISFDLGAQMDAYKAYWQDGGTRFHVSRKEHHPSTLAHRMFADILYEEIVTNPRRRQVQ